MENINTDFIVPVLELVKDKPFFWGTGFIVREKLYSAAHVFENKKDTGKFSFRFKNQFYPLKNQIFNEYYAEGIDKYDYLGKDPHKDLIIFQIEDLGSPYRFFIGEFTWHEQAFSFGYSVNEETDKIQQNFCSVSIKEHAYYYPQAYQRANPVRLNNCIDLRMIINEQIVGEPLSEGNSGSPVIDENNIIYGMLIAGNDWKELNIQEYTAISSKYIIQK